jgi:NTP-dependent ternary system trypsin peptidase co-occuring protein
MGTSQRRAGTDHERQSSRLMVTQNSCYCPLRIRDRRHGHLLNPSGDANRRASLDDGNVSRLLKLPLGEIDGDYVEIEVDPADLGEDAVELNAAGADVAFAPFSLADSLDRVLPALSTILDRVRKIDARPDKVEMEVGLKIGGETGVIFAKGTAEANFTLKVSWSRRISDPRPGAED